MAAVKKPRGEKGEELVHRTRAMLLRALGIVQERGKSPAEILADQFETNPLMWLEKASRYVPKDLKIDGQVQHNLVDVLASFWAARDKQIAPQQSQSSEEHTVTH